MAVPEANYQAIQQKEEESLVSRSVTSPSFPPDIGYHKRLNLTLNDVLKVWALGICDHKGILTCELCSRPRFGEVTMTTEQKRMGVWRNLDQRFRETQPPLIECCY